MFADVLFVIVIEILAARSLTVLPVAFFSNTTVILALELTSAGTSVVIVDSAASAATEIAIAAAPSAFVPETFSLPFVLRLIPVTVPLLRTTFNSASALLSVMRLTTAPSSTLIDALAARISNVLFLPLSVQVSALMLSMRTDLNVALLSMSDCGASTTRSTFEYVACGIVKFTAPAGLIVIFAMFVLLKAVVSSSGVVTVASVCVGSGVVVCAGTTFTRHLSVFVLFFFLSVVLT